MANPLIVEYNITKVNFTQYDFQQLVYDNSSISYSNFDCYQQNIYVERTTMVEKGREFEYGKNLEYANIVDLS
ncbi:hypothetical protein ACSBR1_014255 [Camellia fascicularis]